MSSKESVVVSNLKQGEEESGYHQGTVRPGPLRSWYSAGWRFDPFHINLANYFWTTFSSMESVWHKKFTLLLQMRTWVLLKSRSTSLWEISSTLTLWRWRLAFRSRSGLQSLWSPTVIYSYFWPSILNIFILLLGQRWDVRAGFSLGGWILGFSQCLALRLRHSAWIGP